MKKLTLLVLTFFYMHMALAEPSNPNVLSEKAQGEEIVISDHLKIVPAVRHEQNDSLHYTMDVIYPQIAGDLTPSAIQFNQHVLKLVDDQLNQFKKEVVADRLHMETLPPDVQHNSFKMDYDIDVIAPKNVSIISLRLATQGMQAGRAHPFHHHIVLNFDLTHGKILALNDLFKSQAAYLAFLAKYSQQKLSQTLQHDDQWMLAEGTKAKLKNYKNWNLEDDALLITFDEYQVAPYTYGAQEVEIPYSELKNLLLLQV